MTPIDPTSLENLHDIILAQPVPWFPPAPGWYAVGLSLLLVLTWFSVQTYLAWQRNRYRRQALAELAQLKKQLSHSNRNQGLLAQLPQLVKRTAVTAYGREMVASLSGQDWLTFLDKTGSTQVFTQGDGRLIIDCSYFSADQLSKISCEQAAGLQQAISHWILNHVS